MVRADKLGNVCQTPCDQTSSTLRKKRARMCKQNANSTLGCWFLIATSSLLIQDHAPSGPHLPPSLCSHTFKSEALLCTPAIAQSCKTRGHNMSTCKCCLGFLDLNNTEAFKSFQIGQIYKLKCGLLIFNLKLYLATFLNFHTDTRYV